MIRSLAFLLLLVASVPVHAATLPTLRAGVESRAGRFESLDGERASLEKSLGEVAQRIESLKSGPSGRGPLLGNAQLDELLRQSQSLGDRLSEVLRAQTDAQGSLREAQAALVVELDQEIGRLQAQWDTASDRAERRALVPRIRELRRERESLRHALPSTLVPSFEAPPADDSEELLERADALYDGEDKLRREERAIAARIVELRKERDLERRMSEFLSEGALFDEHDRRISATVTRTILQPPERPVPGTKVLPPGEAEAARADGTPMVPGTGYSGDPNGAMSGAGGNAPPPGLSPSPGAMGGAREIVETTKGISRMPPERRSDLAAYSDDESIDELTARQKKLRALADELHRKAEESAKRARGL